MLTHASIYFIGTSALLAVLTLMILRIGAMMADCPKNGPAIRTASVTIATGFAAIGAGGIILIVALLGAFQIEPILGLLLSLGLAALCLGLGFTHAVGTLRLVALGEPDQTAKA
jgi:hypothetical protein